MVVKRSKLNPAAQITAGLIQLRHYFPNGKVIRKTINSLEWEVDLQPTSLSKTYRIRLQYQVGNTPKIYVVIPEHLEKHSCEKKLPHVYSDEKQQLCLFFPKAHEWNEHMMIAKTIIPWASEWFQFYELWLATGEWFGEGFHPKVKEDAASRYCPQSNNR